MKKLLIPGLIILLLSACIIIGCDDLFPEAKSNSNSEDGDGDGSDNGNDNGNGGGTVNIIPVISIRNNTGYTVSGIYIKPSVSTDWASDLLGWSSLSDGESKSFTLTRPLSAVTVYDIRLDSSSGGFSFRKYGFTVSNGINITFNASDLDDQSNLPAITVQNRTGVAFNALYLRPSAVPDSSDDWGRNYGSLSNNSDISVTIPIPAANYKIFDIQAKSSNPTNSFTRVNVTVSDGMVLTYTSIDSDNPLIGSPVIVINNTTGYTVSGIYIKPSVSTDWGSNLYGYSYLSDGQSRTFTLSQSLSALTVYDIRLDSSSGNYSFRKYGFTVSDGMIITFNTSDLDDQSNLPDITVQNRTGVAFNAVYLRPSSVPDSSEDWGKNYGPLSNNSDMKITIPIPPDNYTVFDIQTKSTNPTNTYTRKNVAITDGMILTYTSADSDNALIGSPVIVINNNTGYTVSGIYIKPSSSADWGSNLYGYTNLQDGQSRTFTLALPLSAVNVYDFRLDSSSGGFTFRKYSESMSEGKIITISGSDLQ